MHYAYSDSMTLFFDMKDQNLSIFVKASYALYIILLWERVANTCLFSKLSTVE